MGTTRTIDGRLFPAKRFDGGWSISVQADAFGYGCRPQLSLAMIEEYTAVEVLVSGPFPHPVDIRTLGLPTSISDKFANSDDGHPCIGRYLFWDEVAVLESALKAAINDPSAGIPRGRVGWSELDVYLGCSADQCKDVMEIGVGALSGKRVLLRLDHDNASADDVAVVNLRVVDTPNILDLRNQQDIDFWQASGLEEAGDPVVLAREIGIDGIYFPNKNGLLCVSPRMLQDFAHKSEATPEQDKLSP
jgi:hypothetical protein